MLVGRTGLTSGKLRPNNISVSRYLSARRQTKVTEKGTPNPPPSAYPLRKGKYIMNTHTRNYIM